MNIFNIIETTYINTSFVEKLKLSFNQFFVVGRTGKIIVIETGFKSGFLQFCDNMVAKGFDPKNIIGVITPHFEADEMGAIGEFMKISPNLKVYSHPICSHGIHDIFGAKTVPVKDGEDVVIDGIKFKKPSTIPIPARNTAKITGFLPASIGISQLSKGVSIICLVRGRSLVTS